MVLWGTFTNLIALFLSSFWTFSWTCFFFYKQKVQVFALWKGNEVFGARKIKLVLHGQVFLCCSRRQISLAVPLCNVPLFIWSLKNSFHAQWFEGQCTFLKINLISVKNLFCQAVFYVSLQIFFFVVRSLVIGQKLFVKHPWKRRVHYFSGSLLFLGFSLLFLWIGLAPIASKGSAVDWVTILYDIVVNWNVYVVLNVGSTPEGTRTGLVTGPGLSFFSLLLLESSQTG